MILLIDAACSYLRWRGYTVLLPGQVPACRVPEPGEMAALLSHAQWFVLPPGCPVPVSLDAAMVAVRDAGYALIQRVEAAPELGRWEVPTPKVGERASPDRIVTAVEGEEVRYVSGGVEQRCKIHSFHAWRRKWKAAFVPAVEVKL